MEEVHLCIVWEKARHIENRVLEYCLKNFRILRVCEVTWSKEYFNNNLSRLYGENLPQGCHKEEHCGNGPFLLIIFVDERTRYGFRNTTKGQQKVNTRIFDFKTLFREISGGGHKIHATNTPKETGHDLALLMGKSIEEVLGENRRAWDKNIEKTEFNLVGHNGWDNIRQLFHILNLATDYVVLRNYEVLPERYNSDQHGDIDLLCSNYREMCFITNAKAIFREPYRVHNSVKVAGAHILFDFRYVGDGYYDENWEKNILKQKKLHNDSFYVPSDTDYFYSLLYHSIIHKKDIAKDYSERLSVMAREIPIEGDIDFCDRGGLSSALDIFMKENGFRYTKPFDVSVPHDELRTLNDEAYYGLKEIFNNAIDMQQFFTTNGKWPMQHHLSLNRRNLLDWYDFDSSATLLEIGGGYGALTGLFAEKLKKVVVYETSKRGVEIIRKRYANYCNLEIYSDDFEKMVLNDKFDYITLIGGIGYIGAHTESKELYLFFLKRIRKLLKEEGVMIIAIDNEYKQRFDGSRIASYIGSSGYPNLREYVKLSKDDMIRLLKKIGFHDCDVYYPVPNYRMPHAIYSDSFLPPYIGPLKNQYPTGPQHPTESLLIFARND